MLHFYISYVYQNFQVLENIEAQNNANVKISNKSFLFLGKHFIDYTYFPRNKNIFIIKTLENPCMLFENLPKPHNLSNNCFSFTKQKKFQEFIVWDLSSTQRFFLLFMFLRKQEECHLEDKKKTKKNCFSLKTFHFGVHNMVRYTKKNLITHKIPYIKMSRKCFTYIKKNLYEQH